MTDALQPGTLRIGTDGAAIKNPGPAGWAWVDEHGRFAAGAWPKQTNNVAELTAIKQALADHPDTPLVIESDSQYAINCITAWGRAWRRTGGAGKKNVELVFSILDLIDARTAPVKFEWVRGHSATNAHPLNTAADAISAAYAAKRSLIEHETGQHEIDWEGKAGSAAAPERSRAKRRTGANGAWANQTAIGEQLGLSARQVGTALEKAGLREGQKPTPTAVEAGLVKKRKMKNGAEYYVWKHAEVIPRLKNGAAD